MNYSINLSNESSASERVLEVFDEFTAQIEAPLFGLNACRSEYAKIGGEVKSGRPMNPSLLRMTMSGVAIHEAIRALKQSYGEIGAKWQVNKWISRAEGITSKKSIKESIMLLSSNGFGMSLLCSGALCCIDIDGDKGATAEELYKYLAPIAEKICSELDKRHVYYLYEATVHGAHIWTYCKDSDKHEISEGDGSLFGVGEVGFRCSLDKNSRNKIIEGATCFGRDYSNSWITLLPENSRYNGLFISDGRNDFSFDYMTDASRIPQRESSPSAANGEAVGTPTMADSAPIYENRDNTVNSRILSMIDRRIPDNVIFETMRTAIEKGKGFGDGFTETTIWRKIEEKHKYAEENPPYEKKSRKKTASDDKREAEEEEYLRWSEAIAEKTAIKCAKIANDKCYYLIDDDSVYDSETKFMITEGEYEERVFSKLQEAFSFEQRCSERIRVMLARRNNFSSKYCLKELKRVKSCDFQTTPYFNNSDGRIIWIDKAAKEFHIDNEEVYMKWQSDHNVRNAMPPMPLKDSYFTFNEAIYNKTEQLLADGKESYLALEKSAPLYFSIMQHNLSAEGRQSLLECLGMAICPIIDSSKFAAICIALGPKGNNGKSLIIEGALELIGGVNVFDLKEETFINTAYYECINSLVINDKDSLIKRTNREMLLRVASGEKFGGQIKHEKKHDYTNAKRMMFYISNYGLTATTAENAEARRTIQIFFHTKANAEIQPIIDKFNGYTPTIEDANALFSCALAVLMAAVRRGGLQRLHENVEEAMEGDEDSLSLEQQILSYCFSNVDKLLGYSTNYIFDRILAEFQDSLEFRTQYELVEEITEKPWRDYSGNTQTEQKITKAKRLTASFQKKIRNYLKAIGFEFEKPSRHYKDYEKGMNMRYSLRIADGEKGSKLREKLRLLTTTQDVIPQRESSPSAANGEAVGTTVPNENSEVVPEYLSAEDVLALLCKKTEALYE